MTLISHVDVLAAIDERITLVMNKARYHPAGGDHYKLSIKALRELAKDVKRLAADPDHE